MGVLQVRCQRWRYAWIVPIIETLMILKHTPCHSVALYVGCPLLDTLLKPMQTFFS